MKIAWFIPGLLLGLVSACLAQGDSQLPLSNLAGGSALIRDLKGEVSVQLPHSSNAPASRGQELPPDTVIETGKGRILLQLQDGSQILVKPHTRAVLRAPDQAAGNFLETLIGKVLATIRKRTGGEPPFRMGTPTAVITVRGTRFLVEVTNRPRTVVSVYDGIVEVFGVHAPGGPVLLGPGFSTTVEQDQEPQSPQPLPQINGGAGMTGTSRRERERDEQLRQSHGNDSQQPQSPDSPDMGSPEQEVED